ncbi:hypothetical protein ACFOOK_26520 [Micromonospora krabiensis]|uniref:Uncharacterized protein n=1 Tax=Micromonospora krabiensis TaxID=307121 RepID=A0A1C3N5L8_9ACTN|nr:hypothetical protein [Micromonospora krabiensis]SBV27877.1 hypothetical protein GA0070620_3408 [Micromonospora krabiensis]
MRLCAYDEELETEIDRWVKDQLDEAPELGEGIMQALRQSGEDSAHEE